MEIEEYMMENYEVCFAAKKDIPAIMQFINEYWKENHILARNRDLFEWQYLDGNQVNMVLGIGENREVMGILGYIPYGLDEDKDIALALWKVRDDTNFLGIKLLTFLINNEPHKTVFCNGINMQTTQTIYQRFGFKTNKLKHWYRLRDMDTYKIAEIKNKEIPKLYYGTPVELTPICSLDELRNQWINNHLQVDRNSPNKCKEYIEKKYFNHPVYEYQLYLVSSKTESLGGIIVLRVQECNAAKALRIIDYIGNYNLLYLAIGELEDLAEKVKAEYIDLYETGLNSASLIRAGWLKVGEDENVIPNFFAPYVLCNVDIFYSSTKEEIILFKGDGDQDRPN